MSDQKLRRPNGKKYKPRDIRNLTQSTIRKGIVGMIIQDYREYRIAWVNKTIG